MGSPVGGIPLAGPFLEGCDTLDLICSFWRGKLMNWYGNEVAAQLQLPVNDPEASIVDDMRAVLQNPYFSLTSIQSTDDYTVNAKAIPLCVNLACTGYDDLLVGNGSQYWPSHIAHHNYSLGGLGIAEQPVSHSELDDYLSMNHSSTLRHRLTAEWVADALLAPGKEEQEEPIFTGSSSTILVFDTSGSMEDQDLSGLTKLEAAVDAGENILEIITAEAQAGVSAGNQIGVVNFSEDAWVGSELTTDMATVRSALAYLYADGGTALPKGFETAINLSNNSTSTGRPIIILLSDGMPNIGLNYEEDELIVQQQALDLASSAGSSGICVYTVGFGVPGTLGNLTGEASINEEFLTAIAERSGCGKYYNAQNATELANVYINLRHESVGELQFQKQGEISQDEQVDIGSVDIPANQDMMLFTLKWPGSQLDPVLIDPAGRSVDPGYPGASISQTSTLATVIIQSPKAGRWRVGAKGIDVPEGRTTYSAVISTRIGEVSSGYRVPGNRNTPPIILLIMLIVVGGGFVYVVSQRKIKTDAYLQITSTADGFKQVQINDQFVIGRSRFAQLRLTDRSVSRRHASIRYVKGSWFIQDLGSSGGTFVNGQRIQATRLNNGDQIRISNSTMIFRC
ncbi:MAG: FHA domain-containing protein [FCB group bacterium]|nr:FHA domain-containing protein [FCB group bacterium]